MLGEFPNGEQSYVGQDEETDDHGSQRHHVLPQVPRRLKRNALLLQIGVPRILAAVEGGIGATDNTMLLIHRTTLVNTGLNCQKYFSLEALNSVRFLVNHIAQITDLKLMLCKYMIRKWFH